jgi:hypothetical protein
MWEALTDALNRSLISKVGAPKGPIRVFVESFVTEKKLIGPVKDSTKLRDEIYFAARRDLSRDAGDGKKHRRAITDALTELGLPSRNNSCQGLPQKIERKSIGNSVIQFRL